MSQQLHDITRKLEDKKINTDSKVRMQSETIHKLNGFRKFKEDGVSDRKYDWKYKLPNEMKVVINNNDVTSITRC